MSKCKRSIVRPGPVTLLVISCLAAQAAAGPPVERLWPDGAPGAKGTAEGDTPTLTIYVAPKDKATGAAVVICPGGGYGHLAVAHEGHQIAQWLNSFGVAGFMFAAVASLVIVLRIVYDSVIRPRYQQAIEESLDESFGPWDQTEIY